MKQLKILFLLFGLLSIFSFADEIRPAYLQIIALDENSYDVVWKVPVKRSGEKLALNVEFNKSVLRLKNPIGAYVGKSYIENWRIYREGGLDGTSVQIKGFSSAATEVLLRIIDKDGIKTLGRISPQASEYTFTRAAEKWDTIKTYTELGIEHIMEGMDHLLFVACLVMIATTFRKLFWTITGFTLAHSATLFLSTMDLVRLPIPPIEASIALSIVFLAVEIAKGDKNSLAYRHPVVVSSSFGLLHGFGFASALMEIGLPQQERVTALLFFNVGVEIGQLIFVVFLLAVTWLIHKTWKKSTMISWFKPASYFIGTVASMWLIERILAF